MNSKEYILYMKSVDKLSNQVLEKFMNNNHNYTNTVVLKAVIKYLYKIGCKYEDLIIGEHDDAIKEIYNAYQKRLGIANFNKARR